ncbi:transglutaminase-like cysteine peptidase [Brevundimonas sp. VNH65]|uniref:transglutaminase-like cysteine peptidase n=1 Tax=Brevundimonas sp. VNH65 TaxID=3400917 RepID=UPI003C021F5F
MGPAKSRTVLLLGATIATVSLGAGVATAQDADSRAPAMVLGDETHAPPGFLDMCRRSPQDCSPRRLTAEQSADASRAYARLYWRAVFARPVEAPAAAADLVRSLPGTAKIDVDTNLVEMGRTAGPDQAEPEDPAKAATRPAVIDALPSSVVRLFQAYAIEVTKPMPPHDSASAGTATEPAPQVTLDTATWATLNGVNRRLNRSIRHTPDAVQFGKEDHWAEPTGRKPKGDCEDYVLAKRRELIEAGISPDALSIALVRTPWDELHAVLLVNSDRGEMVMDNLSPWITRWDRTQYEWLERQTPGQPLRWTRVISPT